MLTLVIDKFHALEELVVQDDSVAQFAQHRTHFLRNLIHLIVAVRLEDIEENAYYAIEQQTGTVERHDGILERRFGFVIHYSIHLCFVLLNSFFKSTHLIIFILCVRFATRHEANIRDVLSLIIISTFTIYINIVDQEKMGVSAKAKIHFTSAPAFYWDNNSNFDVVNLNDPQVACKIRVNAPGKIKELTVKLEDGADPKLMSYIKNRTAAGGSLIDLITDEKAGTAFKDYFPSGATVNGKIDVALDFSFVYAQRFDMGPSTNIFTIFVKDVNNKEASTQVKFKL